MPADYVERCYAGWLGKVIGVRHGAPIEGWTYDRIRKLLGEVEGYPAEYRDFAADDDTNGPLFFLRALADYECSRQLTAEQIGLTWLNYAPWEHAFFWWGGYGKSTEHTAYLNLRAGIPAPRSGSVAQNGAAVAEQIGGQIFIDAWGLVAPGDPALAAELAEKAASVSHGGNGVYGGQFVASAIAAAFTAGSVRQAIDRALAEIPAECEYAAVVRDVLAFRDGRPESDWRDCMAHIIAHWGYDRYPGNCHIIPNAAVMAMAMAYGQDDFSRTINICNMAGWDTDCNVGNVGAIMGTLVGLRGIEGRWREPINDFLAASSVVGCLNIMNLPDCVRLIANLGYRLAGEQPPAEWAAFLSGGHAIDFTLPGSTCAMRTRGGADDRVYHEDEHTGGGRGALRLLMRGLSAGDDRYLYHRTYYRPEHFTDSRYDPAFSPIAYPGQTVRLRASATARLTAVAYALDLNGGGELLSEPAELSPGQWNELTLRIPPSTAALIGEVGVRVTALGGRNATEALYLAHMDIDGAADYRLDYSKERMEVWHGLHREVSQMTILKGIWDLVDGRLMGSASDLAAAYTGDVRWGDQEISCRWRPDWSRGRTGFCLRTQGAIRGYAVLVDAGGVYLMKDDNGCREMGRCHLPDGPADVIELKAIAEGGRLSVWSGDRKLIEAADDAPYLTGMVGLSLTGGGHALYDWLRVRVL
ncbi:MAG: ADP-ribosylglycohydrolase family protein [Clostridiales bacterium]|nr:ADP-ribosylglycohydrolase family protein [Clostridiales bacterium]